MKQGLIQIYTGDGKGKTTAATGLIVRSLGQNFRVLLVRFLKPETPVSGEIRFLEGTEGLTILTAGVGVFDPSTPPEVIRASVQRIFAEALEALADTPYDLAVFDELNGVLQRGDLPLQDVLDFLAHKPEGLEVVITGRNAPDKLLQRADLISRIDPVKHPFDQGIAARRGIEF